MKEYTSAWNAIGFRFAVIFGFSFLGWFLAEIIFEELTRVHFAVIAVAALFASPRYSSYQTQNEKVHCLKWWGFKYLEGKKEE